MVKKPGDVSNGGLHGSHYSTFDSKGRYKVGAGLEFFYDAKGSTTLKEARRKYLEPNTDMPAAGGKVRPSSNCGRKCA